MLLSLLRRSPTTATRAFFRQQYRAIPSMASDILPIRLSNDVKIEEDNPVFAKDTVLQKLLEVQEERTKEVRMFGPWLASDVLDTKQPASPAPASESQAKLDLASDLLLSKIRDAQTARVHEIVQDNPEVFPPGLVMASDILPTKEKGLGDVFLETVQEAEAVRLQYQSKLWGDTDHDGTMASDVQPVKTVGAKQEKPGMDKDTLLQKLHEISRMRVEEYEEEHSA